MAELLDGVRHALVVHAHPDDEVLAGGALLRELHERGIRVSLVTCSRGEAGEIVAGVLPADTGDAELAAFREGELRGSIAALGIDAHYWLGAPPARAAGREARSYRDSGMRWIRPGVAGPGDERDRRSLTAAPLEEVVADLDAVLALDRPDLVIGYDDAGGYGHPDHVRAREAALAAARAAGIPYAELIDDPEEPGVEWFALPQHREAVLAALRSHRTQLAVAEDGRTLVHSGGQRQDVPLEAGLRLVR
ncbi:PIG-L family deacetylase [Gulosibacter sp. 10]|uniref:PIG-L family deacetylase n=1 Tax=Gulosibacter sp. 10 TaxID=1255570 RepID=UPI00097EEA2C|nr:PIG-L family deacetylase [Gulosibacter sp. 10]SJM56178.1 N-acetyl-1-D-myo-inosityl-2-amino-2-deoxy-alpha-D-glucopyranoside deacetylase MshB [Gulosibacter sp. 10]